MVDFLVVTGLLLIGGEGPSREGLAHHAERWDRIVAADSGYDLALELGLKPELVVGDMDSIAAESLARIAEESVRRFPADKDETDTEIGLRTLREMGCDRIVIAGGGGGRMDHFLGILGLFQTEDPPHLWITADTVIALAIGEETWDCRRGEVVSFFAAGDGTRVVESAGLRWPLDGLVLGRGRASLSNLTVSERIEIKLGSGRLLLVRSIEGR